ncbi:hypothetical protein Taro_018459 [Colocasia esculenta]|uniref:C2 domain-containing protein n=1 Tax=Colocasia esculenta TaxID=4460 RepID=A0A843UR40_COLES|nr:hypothetical protein [Colocasia esculenta]
MVLWGSLLVKQGTPLPLLVTDQDKNPAWNETFKFRVQYPAPDNQYKLTLRIMDKDTFTRDDFVGETTVHLGDVIQMGAESGFSELRPRKYNVLLADRTYCGEIRLGVTRNTAWKKSLEGGNTALTSKTWDDASCPLRARSIFPSSVLYAMAQSV